MENMSRGRRSPLPDLVECPSTSTPAASPRTPISSNCAKDGYADRSVESIAHEMFSLADGGDVQRQEGRTGEHRAASWPPTTTDSRIRKRNCSILSEGFPTYGGHGRPRPGGDRDRSAKRWFDEDYLEYRARLDTLPRAWACWPRPVCRSCSRREDTPIYIDAGLVPAADPRRWSFPAQSLACALYLKRVGSAAWRSAR